MTTTDPRRGIPPVDRLLASAWCAELAANHGQAWVAARLRELLAEMRGGAISVPASEDEIAALLRARIAAAATPSLRRVVNATGVVLHTNLGRAPLAREACRAMAAASGYGTVEFGLEDGRRGSRHLHCKRLVCELTGAADAIVVNNNAAAVALALTAFASGRGVAVSHGELVEIGGGFRIPEVIEAAGAKLVAVGTTNRTRPDDYQRAVAGGRAAGAPVAAILKVHRSNFSMSGFTEETALEDLVAVGAALGVPVIHDLGSGLLVDPAELGLPPEPTPADSVGAGADLVAFSGDKLLGGPQAGVLAGKADAVARARAHPLCRAVRCDKVTLAAMEATLALYRNPSRAKARVPALRMIGVPASEIERRARVVLEMADVDRLASAAGESARTRRLDEAVSMDATRPATAIAALRATVQAGESLVGGGTCPDARIPTAVISLRAGDADERWMARLRAHATPVIARRTSGRVVLDLRTVDPDDDAVVASALADLAHREAVRAHSL